MTEEKETIFHKIARKEIPSHIIWESDTHMAFLSRWPNTEGFSVVIPKQWYPSNFTNNDPDVLHAMVDACKEVAQKIERAYEDVGRVGMVFEGFGVDYLHAKLIPMHDTVGGWEKRASESIDKYYETYPGYLATHDSKEVDEETLTQVAEKIKNA